MSGTPKWLQVAGIIAAVPAALGLLWLDLVLAFGFGGWIGDTYSGGSTEGSVTLGIWSFVLMVVAEVVAVYFVQKVVRAK